MPSGRHLQSQTGEVRHTKLNSRRRTMVVQSRYNQVQLIQKLRPNLIAVRQNLSQKLVLGLPIS